MTITKKLSRRGLHLTIAAVTLIAWACDDDGGGMDESGGSSTDDGSGTNPGTDPSGGSSNPSGSGDPSSDSSSEGVGPLDVLRSLANNALAPTFAEFSDAAQGLQSATAAYSEAVASGGDAEPAFADVRTAFDTAMQAWQVAEVMQLGLATGSSGIGGEFLRDEIYSWPSVNTCRVDQELVVGEYAAADFTSTRLVNAYGLDAIEYLLFVDGSDNTCPPQLPINMGEWAALGDQEVATRRAAYAAAIAADVSAVASRLATTWAEGGEWNGYLQDPSSGPLESVQNAMDEVLRAMFYVDTVLKDAKIARPAGIKDCTSDTCLDSLESLHANFSKEQAIANLEGFRRLYHAGLDADAGVGFDDWLEALGEGGLGQEMLADTQGAISALEAVEGTFVEALIADDSALDASHAAIVELTNDLKGDFPTILMLNIPSEAAGDAD